MTCGRWPVGSSNSFAMLVEMDDVKLFNRKWILAACKYGIMQPVSSLFINVVHFVIQAKRTSIVKIVTHEIWWIIH